MVTTVKFSEFDDINTAGTNTLVGLSDGMNAKSDLPISWTTALRPVNPTDGTLGYNTDISLYEFWDSGLSLWRQLGSGGSGSVTQIDTGAGLTGGPIVESGTISFAVIQANSFLANTTGSPAVPSATSLAAFLLSANNLSDLQNAFTATVNLGLEIGVNVQAWNAILNQISAGVWTGAASITTLGTITTGVWEASEVTVPFGGTSNSAFTAYSVICGGVTSTGALQSVVNVGSSGQVLTSNGAAALPTWQTNGSGSGTVNAGLINQLAWYTANGTAVSGLTTAINSGLVTNGSGVPAWVTATGTGAPVLANTPTLITPNLGVATATSIKLPNMGQLLDPNGNVYLTFFANTGAINNIAITNTTTGLPPIVSAVGVDTNVILSLKGQGTGGATVQGTGTNNNAASGFVGEFLSATLVAGSATSLTNNIPKTIISIALSAGDWDVGGQFTINPAGTTVSQLLACGISLTTNTFPPAPDSSFNELAGVATTAGANVGIITGVSRVSISTTTTVYLIGFANFTISTNNGYGMIWARRAR